MMNNYGVRLWRKFIVLLCQATSTLIGNISNVYFLFLLLFICLHSIIYSEENINNNIKLYMELNNMDYPINKNFLLEKSFYRYDNYDDLELTEEQRNILLKFIEIFNSDPKYIYELIAQSRTNTFSIINIILENNKWENKYLIVLAIAFYSDHKIYDMWQYNEENSFWWTHNSAYYYFDESEIELKGWGY